MSLSSATLLAEVRDLILQETAAQSDHTDLDIYSYMTSVESEILDIAIAKSVHVDRQELLGSLITSATLPSTPGYTSPQPGVLGFTNYNLPSDYRAPKIVYLSNGSGTQQRSYMRNEFLDEETKKGIIYGNQYYTQKGGVYFEGQYLLVKSPNGWAGSPTVKLAYAKNPTAISGSQNPEIGDAFRTPLLYGTVAKCFLKTQENAEADKYEGYKVGSLQLILGS
jgi:hypothetical protein